MNRLPEIQRDFAEFVWHVRDTSMAGIVTNGIEPERRLSIYRNNTLLGLTEVLRSVFPVVRRLVGDRFFDRLSREFILARPPLEASLLSYGKALPDFLASWGPVDNLPYLADTARLEWFCHEVYHEANDSTVDWDDFQAVMGGNPGTTRIRLRPSVRLLKSEFPVDLIWRANQDVSAEVNEIKLSAGGCRLLIYRPEWQAGIVRLDEGGYRLFQMIEAGSTLNDAVQEALSAEPGFDLVSIFRLALSQGLFAKIKPV